MVVKKLNRVLLILIPVIFIILAALLLFTGKAKSPSTYDFIAHFNDSKKTGFDESFDVNGCLPSWINSFDTGFFLKQTALLFSNVTRYIEAKNYSVPESSSVGFRLKYFTDDTKSTRYTFILKNMIKVELYREGKTVRIDLSDNGKHLTSLEYELDSSIYQVLNILAFDDYLILMNDTSILLEMKDHRYGGKGISRCELPPFYMINENPLYVLKHNKIGHKAKQVLLNYIKENYPGLGNHIYNFTGRERKWNEFGKNDQPIEDTVKSKYIRRLKLKEQVSSSIYFTVNSSLEYAVDLPNDRAILSFLLTAVPRYIIDPSNINFIITVTNGDKTKTESINLEDIKNSFDSFNEYSIDLSEFSPGKCSITFSLVVKNNNLSEDEKRILVALAAPVLKFGRLPDEKNIILISLDTLRADHLGCYGYDRDTSVNIDALSKKGTLFTNATANSNWTLPSHLSIFTGFYPFETGFIKNPPLFENSFLSKSCRTLTEYLKSAGYYTVGVHGGIFIGETYGFDRGFYRFIKKEKNIKIDKSLQTAIDLLEDLKNDKFFLFFHTYEIHSPYNHRYYLKKENKSDVKFRDRIMAAYDSGIRYTDDVIVRLFEWLKQNNLEKNTLIILLSDHGENFDILDSKKFCGKHGINLFDSETRIPLILYGPDDVAKGKVIDKQVSQVDILPTILDYLQIEPEKELRGQSLFKIIKQEKGEERMAYSEATHTTRELKSIRTVKHKFIASYSPGKVPEDSKEKYLLYNLKQDPNETQSIWVKNQKTGKLYLATIERIIKSIEQNRKKLLKPTHVSGEVDQKTKDELRNLGYLGN